MSYMVCHMAKYTRSTVSGLQRHNQRENKNYGNENIDLEKSKENYDLQNQQNIKYLDRIDGIINNNRLSDRGIRKDAIVYVDTVVGSDKEFFNKLSPEENKRFFEQSYEYLKNKVGENNVVAAVVHMDETKGVGGSPHMHFSFVPMNEDGTLSAKKKINRNFLREIQDEFPRYMKEHGFDIERGVEKSIKKHLEPLDYKKAMIKEEFTILNKQHEEFKEKLESIKKTSETLSKVDSNSKVLLDKLDKIDVKKAFLSDRLTISEQDYSTLVSLAKVGESKVIENLKLKSKIGNLQQKLEKSESRSEMFETEFERLKGSDIKCYDLERKYKGLKGSFERVENALNKLDLVDKVNNEIKSIQLAERSMNMKKRRSFDMER